ncbi:hypothetical protein EVAR_99212_1 [Eumeta japonica]|uniref:Uncharacterized protein n=1 Tax=Eumeta variegata TaxID=151549 RepID=A0A4C1YV76_EUMVA|nr:hypothetical protein EVAR_99212_1 [Eumeta japonica]
MGVNSYDTPRCPRARHRFPLATDSVKPTENYENGNHLHIADSPAARKRRAYPIPGSSHVSLLNQTFTPFQNTSLPVVPRLPVIPRLAGLNFYIKPIDLGFDNSPLALVMMVIDLIATYWPFINAMLSNRKATDSIPEHGKLTGHFVSRRARPAVTRLSPRHALNQLNFH